jgi:hypothetical protein
VRDFDPRGEKIAHEEPTPQRGERRTSVEKTRQAGALQREMPSLRGRDPLGFQEAISVRRLWRKNERGIAGERNTNGRPRGRESLRGHKAQESKGPGPD